jgi:integrase/recombinase XerD
MPLLEHVGLMGILHDAAPKRSDVLERYRRHLRDERGLSATVRAAYEAVAEEFLEGRRPETVKAGDVLGYVQQHAGQPGLVSHLSALRSILRFLHATGIVAAELVLAVPSTACWRQASLPRALDPAQVRAVLGSCDRRTTTGRRDYAVILLMLRLGLRACEVAALTLDDIDWVAGEIVVKGKGSMSRLPLPVDVGEALVAWLRRRRRRVSTRAVFLTSRAPHSAASVTAIRGVAHYSLRRANVPSGGSHRLRHTAATLMLRRGASLTEIAQVLRHRHVDTTAIYAKVDRSMLGGLACPWPVGYDIDRAQLSTLAQPWPGGVT